VEQRVTAAGGPRAARRACRRRAPGEHRLADVGQRLLGQAAGPQRLRMSWRLPDASVSWPS
jgi:hypothetical protein